MPIEIKKENYYIGLWRASLLNGDFLAVLWKEHADGMYRLKYRFRYYRDEKAFGSDDEKAWYLLTGKTGTPDEADHLHAIMTDILRVSGEQFGVCNVQYIACNGDGDAMTALLMNPERPGFHRATLSAKQSRDYERTGELPTEIQSW